MKEEKTVFNVCCFQQARIQVNGQTIYGVPFVRIIQEVLDNHCDLDMIITDFSSALRRTILGSTSMHLMRKCLYPVRVIKPNLGEILDKNLAAVDLNGDDLGRDDA